MSSPVEFTGTATDATGVGEVAIAIKRLSDRSWLQDDGTFGPDYNRILANLGAPGANSTSWSLTQQLDKK